MIGTFKHKGLKALYEERSASKISPTHIPKLTRILSALDEATQPKEMNLPGFRLHALKGEFKGYYAISVSGNWRVTFRFEDGNAGDIDYVDYH